MVSLEIRIRVARKHRAEFTQLFESLTRPEHRSPGCLDQALFEQVRWDDLFLWIEQWTGNKGVSAYLESDRFRTVLAAVGVLGEVESIHMARTESHH